MILDLDAVPLASVIALGGGEVGADIGGVTGMFSGTRPSGLSTLEKNRSSARSGIPGEDIVG